jgi:PadR family transcriptional regulator, regulatory protein AphA
MDVKTLCLCVLTEGDKSGYEIKRCFEEAFSHFFVAGFGSIYPALAELSRSGLVTSENVEQEGRPDKKVYSLTPAGERLLTDELSITPPRHKVRSEFLVLMYFAHLLPPARLAAIIDERIAQWELTVAEIDACLTSDDAHASPGMRFAAGYGRAVIGAALAYVRANKAGLVQQVAATVRPERVGGAGAGTAPGDQIVGARPRAKRRSARGRNEIAGTHDVRA